MISPSGSHPDEARAFLDAHPDDEAIDILLTDLNGIGRGKTIRRHELLSIYESGRHLPGSILGLDICSEDVEETGLVWEDGDADRRAWPIPGTLTTMAWTTPRRAQVLLSQYELDGSPSPADPRHALARQTAALKAKGFGSVAAFEVEFYLLDPTDGPDGKPRPASFLLSGRSSRGTDVYSVEVLDEMTPLFADVYAGAKAMGLPLETLISEYAPGQFELTLHHRPDVLKAADDLILTKRLLRAVARRHGAQACFMAKPVAGYAGSGMHLHLSFTDTKGDNVFADVGDGLSTPLLHAIGGLKETLPDSMAVLAPHSNSWRRFAANSYAPVSATWGVNNRSVALRVPAGSPKGRHLEHRVAGIDANPYLVAALTVAGAVKGIDAGTDPGPAVTGNGYEQSSSVAIPADWRSALDVMATSDFAADALGARFRDVFVAVKRAELARTMREIPDIDYRLYRDVV